MEQAPEAVGDVADRDAEPEAPEVSDAPAWALGRASATDHVRLLMEIVMGELRRPDHPRLIEIDRGRWWLRSDKDLAQARPPLSDRLEWAVYGLLSTSRGIDEETYFERVTGMFRGHDTPDLSLVRAVLDSYRDPSMAVIQLRPQDELTSRHAEHGEICGLLVEYGHRLGLRAHVSAREGRRAYRGATVADLLSDEEQRAYMPLIAPGDAQTFETLDCVWYLRGKATFVFEVEWTAMLTDALLRRGPRIPADDLDRPLPGHPARARRAGALQAGALAAAGQGSRRAELAYPQVRSPAPTCRPRGGRPGHARPDARAGS